MKALVVVDIQNDFLPGGALAASDGDKVIPVINELMKLPFDIIVATKDWHPKVHCSFSTTHNKKVGERVFVEGIEQILWPEHCVQGTPGAEFSKDLDTEKIEHVVYKGTELNVDSYSTFFNNKHLHDTGLDAILKKKGVDEVYIAGLVTDYCVKNSAKDALKLGYKVFVVRDACRAANLDPHDEKKAIEEMKSAGTRVINFSDIKIKDFL